MADERKDITELLNTMFHDGLIASRDKKEGVQFHSLWRDNTTVESATMQGNNIKAVWRFPVLREYSNPGKFLHGAAQALFYDQCIGCSTILLAKPGFWEDLGFTRNLIVNYLRTAKIGEFVLMETEIVQIGRSMGYMQGTMRRERDGAIISTSEQNKFSTDAGMTPKAKL